MSTLVKEKLTFAEEYNHTLMKLGRYDIILYKFITNRLHTPWELLHKSESKEQGQAIIKAILDKLKAKSDLLHQRQVIKKMGHSQHLLEEINRQLRTEYFELSIQELLV